MPKVDIITNETIKEKLAQYLSRKSSLKQKGNIPLVISFIGGTGVGKSSILNLIAGKQISKSSPIRPTTNQPVVFFPENHSFNPKTLGIIDITFKSQSFIPDESIDKLNIIFFDLPDIDSMEKKHGMIAKKAIDASDVIIFVVSPDKYGDSILYDFLKIATSKHKNIFILFNKIDIITEEELAISKNTLLDNEHFGKFGDSFIFHTLSTTVSKTVHRKKFLRHLTELSSKKIKIRNIEILKDKKCLQTDLNEYSIKLRSTLDQLEKKHRELFNVELDITMKISGVAGKSFESVFPYYKKLYTSLYPFSPLSPVNFINKFAKFILEKIFLLIKYILNFFAGVILLIGKTLNFFGKFQQTEEPLPLKKLVPCAEISELINEMRKSSEISFDFSCYINHVYSYFSKLNKIDNFNNSTKFDRDYLSHNATQNMNNFFESFFIHTKALKKKLQRYDHLVTFFDWIFILLSVLVYFPVKTKLQSIFIFSYLSADFLLFYILFVYLIINFLKKLTFDLILDSSRDADCENFITNILSDFNQIKQCSSKKLDVEIKSLGKEVHYVKKLSKEI